VTRRRWPGRDRGSFTAELAAGLPALILLLLAGLTAVTAVSTRLQCLDAAREGATAGARGEVVAVAAAAVAPDGATVEASVGPDSVTVTVSAHVPVLGITVRGSATAALEPSS
jgi:hypothetical protein